MHRIHNSDINGSEFNPYMGRPTRFAPLYVPTNKLKRCVPTLYAGSDFDCVVFETVFHDVPANGSLKIVPLQSLDNRTYTVIKTKRDLKLMKLFAPELKRMGLLRSQLIDTSAFWYSKTTAWAAAFYQNYRDIDGLVWTSSQCDPSKAYLLFGDRINEGDLISESVKQALTSDILMRKIHHCAKRAGIVLTAPNRYRF